MTLIDKWLAFLDTPTTMFTTILVAAMTAAVLCLLFLAAEADFRLIERRPEKKVKHNDD